MEEILHILEADAHAAPAQIAAQVGLSEEQVQAKIHEWEAEGVIRRYRTVVDWERYGRERVLALIDVKVTPAPHRGFDDVAEHIYRFPQVLTVYLVSGAQDVRCVVEGRSLREVAEFVAHKLAAIEGVTATATHFLLKTYKENGDVFARPAADPRLMVTP